MDRALIPSTSIIGEPELCAREHRAAVLLQNLDVSIGGLPLVKHANLECNTGTITGLTGPNGSGKTTVLNVLTGFVPPTQGAIFYYGRQPSRFCPRIIATIGKGVARSFQTPFVVPELSILDNVLLGRRHPDEGFAGVVRGLLLGQRSDTQWTEEAKGLLIRLGIRHEFGTPASGLSAGERRRICLSRTAFSRAGLLLLDEPFANLDVDGGDVVVSWLRELADKGKTIIVIEHAHERLREIADKIVTIRDGNLVDEENRS